MAQGVERRSARRFTMTLPIELRLGGDTIQRAEASAAQRARTRDVSFRGLYFMAEQPYKAGSPVEFILTLPKEVTLATDVRIRCVGHIVRVDSYEEGHGVAAQIERYEFLPASVS